MTDDGYPVQRHSTFPPFWLRVRDAPVRGALVIASFVSTSPASAPAEGPLHCSRFKKHHPLSRLTPIWTGRVRSESGPGETASCDRAGYEGAACGRQGCSSFALAAAHS